MPQLDVHVPGVPAYAYKVMIGEGLLESVMERARTVLPGRSLFVVTDTNLVQAGLMARLVNGKDIPAFMIDPPGEISKNMQTVVAVLEAMEQAKLGRDSAVVALGGGCVGDIAAFAASIFKRGVPVIQVPTTTLAQADSAIGGKTGVDSSLSKNAFGTFWHPAAVYMDVGSLKTLDRRQYRAGLVESVKHGLIADTALFSFIEQGLDRILAADPEAMTHLALANCRVKASVVERDPNERDMRQILNYGHTIGHAVEAASGYRLLHGEAVSIGMVAAGMIEVELGLSDGIRLGRIRTLLERMGLPTRLPPDIPPHRVLELLVYDKKAIDRQPRFVLTSGLGQVYCPAGQWAVRVDQGVIEKVIRRLLLG